MQKMLLLACLLPFMATAQQSQTTRVEHGSMYPGPVKAYEVVGTPIPVPDTFTFNGNFFEIIHTSERDTITIIDPETGKEFIKIVENGTNIKKMNGVDIVDIFRDSVGVTKKAVAKILTDVTNGLKVLVERLDDGYYELQVEDITIDNKGKMVYYKIKGISTSPYSVTYDLKSQIDKDLEKLLLNVSNWPIYNVNNKQLPYLVQYNQTVYVNGHHMRI